MTLRRSSARAAMVLIASLALSALPAGAQDTTITRAKNLYESADYDQALSVLDQLKGDPAAGSPQEIEAYRVFCLLALGRRDEAHQGITAILRQDPRYQPSESETSPRIRAVFEDERRRILPQIFQERYDGAKASFERKEFQSAGDQFKALLAFVDTAPLIGEESRTEFRVLISGFVDLAQAAVRTQAPQLPASPSTPSSTPPTAPPRTPPRTPPSGPATTSVASPRIYGANDADVIPPVALSKKVPPWRPGASGPALWREYDGMLELVVDEQGNVSVANLRKSVLPLFDVKLIQAAREWKFRPALRQGQPVPYRTFMEVKLVP